MPNLTYLGHYQYEYPSWERETNYAKLEDKELMLLMSYVEEKEAEKADVWFLDSGCSNHIG